jgi:hypothetical protein
MSQKRSVENYVKGNKLRQNFMFKTGFAGQVLKNQQNLKISVKNHLKGNKFS